MFHTVIIASMDRPNVLDETLRHLAKQTTPPDQIVVSVTKPGDLPADIGHAIVVTGPMGSTIQRNAGLPAVDPRCDIVSFFDDDIELAPDYCQRMRAVFERHPDLLGCNGQAIADGTGNGGIPREQARRMIAELPPLDESVPKIFASSSLYGCNMNVRRPVLNIEKFDERLSAYAWLEDFDLSSRIAAHGKLASVPSCRLVHLATTAGRSSGVRMGISQIINPLYIWKKGVGRPLAYVVYNSCFLRIVANLAGVVLGRNARHVDRRGRLKGNMIALGYVLRGRIEPEVVLCH
jgi:GT2 family glycosyltransferase